MMSFMIAIVFSQSSAAAFNEEGLKDEDVLNDLKLFSIETEQEVLEFLSGVDDAVGYEECRVNEVAQDSKVAQIAFGKEASRKGKFKKVTLDSVAARIAYEQGVAAGEGWFGHAVVDGAQMDNLVQALAAMQADGKEHTAENLYPYIKTEDELELMLETLADAEDAKARADRQFPGMTEAQKTVITYVLEHKLMTNESFFTLGDKVRHAAFMVSDKLDGVEFTELELNEIYDNILSR
jgi:hypothetical protein